MYKISKVLLDNTELLPDITETPIWRDYETNNKTNITLIVLLYNAIYQRENYFQLNSPTAFGDPEYRYYCGLVTGILQGSGMVEDVKNEQIVIKKGGRKVLIVDKVVRPQSYYAAKKEIQEVIKECL